MLLEILSTTRTTPLILDQLNKILRHYYENDENEKFRSLALRIAFSGSVPAARLLGAAMFNGTHGFELNKLNAMTWFAFAASNDDRLAQSFIGHYYENPNEYNGGTFNNFAALHWYVRAAKLDEGFQKKNHKNLEEPTMKIAYQMSVMKSSWICYG